MSIMLGVAVVLTLGIGAQWLAWRVRMPSILLLLLLGFVAGPFSGSYILDPASLRGEILLPFVALAVATIMLEGGLSLRFRELQGAGGAVRNLILLGSPLTLVLVAVTARWVLGMDWGLCVLLGAILVVTGPTVIIPLLRHIRPRGSVGSVVRWEGIVSDPVGAILAVLVFQAMLATDSDGAVSFALGGLLKATFAGGVSGAIGAWILVFAMKRDLIPDFLHTGTTLALGIGAFVLSNYVQHESGLLAVTLMGVLLANQKSVVVEHIVEFKENLRVLLISSLFILLAARLPLSEFQRFDLRTFAFVALLILVVRPIVVFFSTLGTSLSWAERAFVAWMAPRGIVAAAVASVFALELPRDVFPDADRLVSIVFAVIVATVAVYGLTAGLLARRLGLASSSPQGVLILGAHAWARQIAHALKGADFEVLLVDTNHHEVQAARIEGLDSYYGNVFSEEFEFRAPLDGIGKMLCLTPNDEVNALACVHFTPDFGRGSIFQLSPEKRSSGDEELPHHLRGAILFGPEWDFWALQSHFRKNVTLKATRLSIEFNYQDFLQVHERDELPVLPLFVARANGTLAVVTDKSPADPQPGDTVIAVIQSGAEEAEQTEPQAALPTGAPEPSKSATSS